MNKHRPYTRKEHWNSFWRMFYNQKKANKLIEIPITGFMREKAKEFSKRVVKAKAKEKVHQDDSNKEWKRWMTGTLGEIVLETFLSTQFRDLTVGRSTHYNVPDLSPIDLRVGVKSFRVGNYPLVNRSKKNQSGVQIPMDGQVFIGISQNLTRAYIFGIAFHQQLSHNESNPNNNRFVKDSNALKRKTAFTELNSLYQFNSLSELQDLSEQNDCLIKKETQKIS